MEGMNVPLDLGHLDDFFGWLEGHGCFDDWSISIYQ